MRANLAAGGGAIMAEAVMMGLAPALGREAAHHAVKNACDRALAEGCTLAEALGREPAVAARMDAPAIAALTEPGRYLGSARAFTDRVIEAARPALGW